MWYGIDTISYKYQKWKRTRQAEESKKKEMAEKPVNFLSTKDYSNIIKSFLLQTVGSFNPKQVPFVKKFWEMKI